MTEYPEIPGYRVKKKLGQGGMAAVYLGVPKNFKELVAIKIINPMIFNDPRLAKRFNKEVRTLKKLHHPNIVAIHDVGEIKTCNYIVMEYFQYSLKEKIKKIGGIPPEEALHITAQIADALFYAHEKKIIHRDIKPDNIMFRKDGTPVLLDFGIAKTTDSSTKITRTGTSVGTPKYMSPEQCNAEKLDGRSDIYSLGVVLFEMLTGRPPYRARTTMGIINKHLQDDVPLLPYSVRQFQPIIDKMMAKEKRKRIRTLDSVGHLIKEALNVNTGWLEIAEKKLSRIKTTGSKNKLPSRPPKKRKNKSVHLDALWTVPSVLVIPLHLVFMSLYKFWGYIKSKNQNGKQFSNSVIKKELDPDIGNLRENPTITSPLNGVKPNTKIPFQERQNEMGVPTIFISYAREDGQKVSPIYKVLKNAGYTPWLDTTTIYGGQVWENEIKKAIKTVDFFLACLSEESMTKDGFVQTEFELGLAESKEKDPGTIYFIPVRLENCIIQSRFEAFHICDVFNDNGINKLLTALEKGAVEYGFVWFSAKVVSGPDKGKEFRNKNAVITIGRAENNSICLSDPKVSAFHAKIVRKRSNVSISDLGGKNPLFIHPANGIRDRNESDKNQYSLNDGDMIEIGKSQILISLKNISGEAILTTESIEL